MRKLNSLLLYILLFVIGFSFTFPIWTGKAATRPGYYQTYVGTKGNTGSESYIDGKIFVHNNTVTNGTGTADYVMVRFFNNGANGITWSVKCSLYYQSNRTFYNSTSARNLKPASAIDQYYRFNFTNPKPRLNNGQIYMVCIWANDSTSNLGILSNTDPGIMSFFPLAYGTWPTIMTFTGGTTYTTTTNAVWVSYTLDAKWTNRKTAWISSGNVTKFQVNPKGKGWITSQNASTLSWYNRNIGWITSQNITTQYQNIMSGWITAQNTSLKTWNIQTTGWITVQNITNQYNPILSGWIAAQNNSILNWNNIISGWLSVENDSKFNVSSYGWITAQNIFGRQWSNETIAWITVENISTFKTIEGWITTQNGTGAIWYPQKPSGNGGTIATVGSLELILRGENANITLYRTGTLIDELTNFEKDSMHSWSNLPTGSYTIDAIGTLSGKMVEETAIITENKTTKVTIDIITTQTYILWIVLFIAIGIAFCSFYAAVLLRKNRNKNDELKKEQK